MTLSDDVKRCERIANEKQKVVNRIHREMGIDAETPISDVHAIRNVLAELARLQALEADARVQLVMMVGEEKPLAELGFDVELGEDRGFSKVCWLQWNTVLTKGHVYPHVHGEWPQVARDALVIIEADGFGFEQEGKP